ncbi:MAG: glutathione S-transferase family protein [Myxococcales bacterium]|nr:glutathione S-transferase family protein [Myxococcales bacterium]
MKLYGFAPTRSIRALWTLRELDLDFEYVQVDLTRGEHRRPEFLAVNPAGKVPVLVDGNFVLTESVAIVLYLAETHPQKGLLPREPHAKAEANRWLLFTATELEQPLWRISRHTALYPDEKRIANEVPIARDDFLDMARVMEKHLEGRSFLVGEHVSVADFVAAHTLDWANEVHLLEKLPNLRAYMELMYARPKAPPRIAEAFASLRTSVAFHRGVASDARLDVAGFSADG